MNTVRELFGIPDELKVVGDVGVEIEVEGRNLPLGNKYWRREVDGSLRGAENAEYVLRTPLTLNQLSLALKSLALDYKTCKATIDDSVRAGVHVHVNVQELNVVQLYNYITLYLVFEELLTKFCGSTREGNLFCLRACDAEFLIQALQYTAQSRRYRTLVTDDLRYAAINVKALGNYGSLEFRAMRSTKDFDVLQTWATILVMLREKAKEFFEPTDIINGFSEGESSGFLGRIFGEYAELLKFDGYERALVRGVRIAQEIAFCTNWQELIEQEHKAKMEFAKAEKVAMKKVGVPKVHKFIVGEIPIPALQVPDNNEPEELF